ncbi:MAG: IS110 family transposase [Dechloromonas sp.]|uniref:IS110 family transposase n=1 Tax=Candidatus Dechloromonas phosphorivorans TaxID=2899244 RepID=A0A9D7LN01_9RHOO|nr:IS110 family transposase [Candidatus Dechloromonas phosphorivorans]
MHVCLNTHSPGVQLNVAVDVGCIRHRVAVGLSEGKVLDEFDIAHDGPGLTAFFTRIEHHEREHQATSVAVAMEGFGGYARPLDARVLMHGWRLFNVNNLKLARFKEIFPAPAKTDAIDARRMLQLFQLQDRVPMAKAVLQEVAPIGETEAKLKALTRRRKQLVDDRMRLSRRLQADLQALCPGLLAVTGEADNLWFLNFLTMRDDLTKLKNVRLSTLLATTGIGKGYAAKIRQWQQEATFSNSATYLGAMIVTDARQILALRKQILALEAQLEDLAGQSVMARRIQTVPGFGLICSTELAGEIGSVERFAKTDSLAMYLGVAPLDNSSGKYKGSKVPRQVNRRARDAMMIAAVQHIRSVPASKAYFDKKRAAGKTHQQAVRAVARMLSKVLFSMLKHSEDYVIPDVSNTPESNSVTVP